MFETDVKELRDIEERLYQMAERWWRNDPSNQAVLFDSGMLAAARRTLDTFLCDENGEEKWIRERDNRRQEARVVLAITLKDIEQHEAANEDSGNQRPARPQTQTPPMRLAVARRGRDAGRES